MSGQYLQMIIILVMIAAFVFFLSDVRKWKSLGSLINSRVKVLRISLLTVLESLLLVLFYGPPVHEHRTPVMQLSYWSLVKALALAVFVIALLDVREVMVSLRKLNREVYDSLKEDRENK